MVRQVILSISGMTCNHCVQAIKGALEKVPGVRSASVSLEEKIATVDFDEGQVDTQRLKDAVEEEGYSAVFV